MTLISISAYSTPLNKSMNQTMKIKSFVIPANYHLIFDSPLLGTSFREIIARTIKA